MGFLVPVLFRPAVHMLWADLVALRVVMVFAQAQPEYSPFGTQDKRVGEAVDALVAMALFAMALFIMALNEHRPTAVRIDLSAKATRWGVVLIAKPSDVIDDCFCTLHYSGEFGVA